MNVKELFEKTFPAAIAANPAAARQINAIVQFNVTGAGGGAWTFDAQKNPPTCLPGTNVLAQCMLEASHDDVVLMLTDSNAGMQLYFQGRLRVSGDPMIAMKLGTIADLLKKAP